MAWTIEEALVDEAIERTEKTNEGYSFWLKNIPTEISIVLSVNPVAGGFNFQLSHSIHTPIQIMAYHPSRPWGDDEAYALHLAVCTITDYYKQAINKGHIPSETWLIANN